jgi:pimeloyl-ACP methyl ester carboxylesterase
MKKYSSLLTLVLLIALAEISSSAQTGKPTFITEAITVETPGATLFGTLFRPASNSPVPVLLIISGSGPTDRDGNSPVFKGPNNSLKLLAEGLAAHGVASVRYDKRTIGETGRAMMLAAEKSRTVLREEDLSFENYIDDAVAWGKKLSADRRFSSITVIGHSEGSLIGMVAAQRMGARAYVSLAGAGRPIQEVLQEQIRSQMPPDLAKAAEDISAQLAAGKRVDSVPPKLNLVFRPSIQPFMISWLRYNPVKEIAALHIPIMIVQGTTDTQVSLRDAKNLAGANPAAKLFLIEGMNHVLKMVPNEPDKQLSSYSDPTLPVATALISEISRFVNESKR